MKKQKQKILLINKRKIKQDIEKGKNEKKNKRKSGKIKQEKQNKRNFFFYKNMKIWDEYPMKTKQKDGV